MGLFGKKKTPEEILSEGRALYDKGDYSKAALVLLKASGKEKGEVDYWIGRCYLALNEKKPGKGNQKLAEQNLRFAAEAGHVEAARLLAERLGVGDFLPQEPASLHAPSPEPVPKPEARPEPVKTSAPVPEPSPETLRRAEKTKETGADSSEKLTTEICLNMEAEENQKKSSAPQPGGELAEKLYAKGLAEYYMFDNKAEALYWYEKAAEQGHPGAQFEYGLMYDKGEGMAMDKGKALYWYEKAAEQGEARAQLNCGSMYDKGEEVVVDKTRALYWYEKAAEQGIAQAQYNCGVMYYMGKGTAKDEAKAKLWFQKVAAQTERKDLQESAKKFLRKYF